MPKGDEVVPFEALVDGDLIVASFNDGGGTKTAADDPRPRLLAVRNQVASATRAPEQGTVRLGVLFTTAAEDASRRRA